MYVCMYDRPLPPLSQGLDPALIIKLMCQLQRFKEHQGACTFNFVPC